VTSTTETRNQNFVVFFEEEQTTVVWNEGSDLLTILYQLDSDTLTNGRVRLLGFNTDLFKDDTLGVGSTTEWVGLGQITQSNLLVVEISPSGISSDGLDLSGSFNTSWFTDER